MLGIVLFTSSISIFAINLYMTGCILLKVGSTRKQVAVAYGQKGGKDNLAILENLVTTSAHLHL